MEKLYGNKRRVFKYVYKNRNKHLTRFNVPGKIKYVSASETIMHLKDLVENNYIRYIGLDDTIQFTSKGLSYFSNETYSNVEICIKSAVFPILISIITTLITMWLKRSL